MPTNAVPIATTAEVLTLVIPAVAFIAVTIWYVVLWRRGLDER
ncbi:MAG TPA: hypothetical protein VKG38_07115 [Solirubrobacteraceae bacterium]|nr:hypothetical protein [Solirubrobacteraceae bacterium]